MVKIISAVGCVLTAIMAGVCARVIPGSDPVKWLIIGMFGVSFACFWVSLNND